MHGHVDRMCQESGSSPLQPSRKMEMELAAQDTEHNSPAMLTASRNKAYHGLQIRNFVSGCGYSSHCLIV
jgi:hypothetical protein